MEIAIHEQNGVIIHQFSGEVQFDDILVSWKKLLSDYANLEDFKGIITNFLDAKLSNEDSNLNVLVEFLKGQLDKLKDLKIAIVMDTPMITNTIIVGERVKYLQIKPFTTMNAALHWVRL